MSLAHLPSLDPARLLSHAAAAEQDAERFAADGALHLSILRSHDARALRAMAAMCAAQGAIAA